MARVFSSNSLVKTVEMTAVYIQDILINIWPVTQYH